MNRTVLWRLVMGVFGVISLSLIVMSVYKTTSRGGPKFQALAMHQHKMAESDSVGAGKGRGNESDEQFWRTADMIKHSVPEQVTVAAETIQVHSDSSDVDEGGEKLHIFYQWATPPANIQSSGLSVLLLHGQAFTSNTWLELGTIRLLAAMGHSVLALDLPGYGKSSGTVYLPVPSNFLRSLVTKLQLASPPLQHLPLSHPVVVSPSMSGGFSLPALLADVEARAGGQDHFMMGYVPVAPVNTKILTKDVAAKVKTPTLIIYGSRDTGLGHTSLKALRLIPPSVVVEVNDAGHPAYLHQPRVFHKLLYNFMLLLKQRQ